MVLWNAHYFGTNTCVHEGEHGNMYIRVIGKYGARYIYLVSMTGFITWYQTCLIASNYSKNKSSGCSLRTHRGFASRFEVAQDRAREGENRKKKSEIGILQFVISTFRFLGENARWRRQIDTHLVLVS